MAGIMAVHQANVADGVYDPNPRGSFPSCKNALWTMVCERCGREMDQSRDYRGPCPRFGPDKRWGYTYEGEIWPEVADSIEILDRINQHRARKGVELLPVSRETLLVE